MLTTEQKTTLRTICQDNQSVVISLTNAAITVAQNLWDEQVINQGIDSLTAILRRPKYPYLPTLFESLEGQSNEIKFACYIYNGLDPEAANLANLLLSTTEATWVEMAEIR